MSFRAVFFKSYKVGEEITNLEFYGVYYGSDGQIRALIGVNGKIIRGFTEIEVRQQLVPNLILPSINNNLHALLHGVCQSGMKQCASAGVLELPKTGGLYMRVKDDVYTLQTWPQGFGPYAPALTLG